MPLPKLPTGFVRRPTRRRLLITLVALAAVAGAAGTYAVATPRPAEPAGAGEQPAFTVDGTWTLLELERHVEAGEVAAITATEPTARGALIARTTDGQIVRIQLAVDGNDAARALAGLGYGDLLTEEAWAAARSAGSAAGPSDPVRSLLGVLLPVLLFGALIAVLLWTARGRGLGRRGRSTSFGVVMPPAAGTPPDAPPANGVRLADVAGCDEAKTELTEVIQFLREPARFAKLGATIPRGVLLFGPPGTGKTMLAKAVASEAGVAFLHVSGSEFVEKYVGVGARRIRDLFAQARALGRAVVFVDEFDALAKTRGGANAHEEREQTLNQLLVELDGFRPADNVVVIAATNRLDVLDAAVLRPGRFNRKIHVGLPDVRGRREILAVHARNKPLAGAVDLDGLARKTYGFSGAQLADLLNEGAILTARRGGETIESADLQAGWLKVAIGTGRRRSMDERERAIIAAHEVGHAICGRVHGDRRRVEEISLFAHGEALGVTVSSQEDNDLPSESDLRARLIALMGGRAAEELLFQDVTGGAANDFEKATQIATSMVTRFGMGRDPEAADAGPSGRGVLSLLVARQGGGLPSEVQPAATRAIRAILDTAYVEACETLVEHLPTLRRIAAYLVEHERVDGETFEALFDGAVEVPTALDEWRPSTTRPREWGDVVPFRDRRFRAGRPDREAVPAADEVPRSIAPVPEPAPVPVAAVAPVADVVSAVPPTIHDTEPVIPSPVDLATAPDPATTPAVPAARSRLPDSRPPAGVARRARRLAAAWLRSASVRLAGTEPTTRA